MKIKVPVDVYLNVGISGVNLHLVQYSHMLCVAGRQRRLRIILGKARYPRVRRDRAPQRGRLSLRPRSCARAGRLHAGR